MKVLIFHAAVTHAATLALTDGADHLRREGHNVGLRNLPSFRRESEPAEAVLVALTEDQATNLKSVLMDLVMTFGEDKLQAVELPEDADELANFDWSGVLNADERGDAAGMTIDQLRAEAVLRGIEVRVDSTPQELAHLLDLDYPAGRQESERLADRRSARNMDEQKIGQRTSAILPNVNGLDLERMNDDQLAAAAAELGLRVSKGIKRETLINKMTQVYASKVGAPADAGAAATEGGTATAGPEDGLDGLDEAGLRKVAEDENIDLGQSRSVDGIRQKIVDARKERTNQE